LQKRDFMTKTYENVNWDAKERRIVRQNVLNRAVDMFNVGKIEYNNILETAKVLEMWIYRK